MPDAIRIFPNKRQKFILVCVSGESGNTLALWGNPDVEWHNDIMQEMTASEHTISEILGGGWLFFEPTEHTLYIWGRSDRLGPAPRELIKEVVMRELPDITLHLDEEPA